MTFGIHASQPGTLAGQIAVDLAQRCPASRRDDGSLFRPPCSPWKAGVTARMRSRVICASLALPFQIRQCDLGDGSGALELPSARRPGGLGSRGHAVNRAADVVLAGLGLVVTSPLLAAAGLAVKLEDGGPVLFRQTRVGKDGKDFELLKLRSMVVDAERAGAGRAVDRGDSRITRVGRLLRRTSIDELPQLWNIVRGDMSVIGPRPTLATRSSATRNGSGGGSTSGPGSPAGRRSTAGRRSRGRSGSSWTSGTSSTARPVSICGSCCGHRSPCSAARTRGRPEDGARRNDGAAGGPARARRRARRGPRTARRCVRLVAHARRPDAPRPHPPMPRAGEGAHGRGHDGRPGRDVRRRGPLRTVVEGGLVTIAIATSEAEAERLRAAYTAGDPGPRLDVHGRYVALWLRPPSPTQRQVTYDCAY